MQTRVGSQSLLTTMKMKDVNDDERLGDNSDEFYVNYRGKKYEISAFLKHHPGGRQILKAYKGLSVDDALEKVAHSKAAFHLFREFELSNKSAYEDIESLIDWNAPLLGQVASLRGRYWEWVNLPVNRSIRLFQSEFLERLTVTPWYMVPLVWIPICIYFFYLGISTGVADPIANSITRIILAFLGGFLLWTFLEYSLHRKLFHMKPPDDSKILISLHFILHGLHHKAPFDDRRLVFPPLPAVLIACIFYYLYQMIFPVFMINMVASGTMTGYLCYDLIHYYLHHGTPNADTYLYTMKRYHNYHHFSHHDQGFGISSKLWDYIFGSLIVLRQLKKAIIW